MNSFKSTKSKVLSAKHTASLQLLYTVGSNQARLDARTKFKILEPLAKGGVEAGHTLSYKQNPHSQLNRTDKIRRKRALIGQYRSDLNFSVLLKIKIYLVYYIVILKPVYKNY